MKKPLNSLGCPYFLSTYQWIQIIGPSNDSNNIQYYYQHSMLVTTSKWFFFFIEFVSNKVSQIGKYKKIRIFHPSQFLFEGYVTPYNVIQIYIWRIFTSVFVRTFSVGTVFSLLMVLTVKLLTKLISVLIHWHF